MAKNNNLKDYLTDLYEGIVSKKPNASRNPQDFRAEIENITAGTVYEEYDGSFVGNAQLVRGFTIYTSATFSTHGYCFYSLDNGVSWNDFADEVYESINVATFKVLTDVNQIKFKTITTGDLEIKVGEITASQLFPAKLSITTKAGTAISENYILTSDISITIRVYDDLSDF